MVPEGNQERAYFNTSIFRKNKRKTYPVLGKNAKYKASLSVDMENFY